MRNFQPVLTGGLVVWNQPSNLKEISILRIPDTEAAIVRALKGQVPSKRAADSPPLRFLASCDLGAFMYASQIDDIPVVSDIQAYLDLSARGGRDQKQADYLFESTIVPMWRPA